MFSSNIPLPALKAVPSPDSGAQTVRATAGALYFGLNAEKELLTIRDNGGNLPGACFSFFLSIVPQAPSSSLATVPGQWHLTQG